MKLSKDNKIILLIAIIFLIIGMFSGNVMIKNSYREQAVETNQELELLSIRKDLIENKMYYEKDIENNPKDIENYNSRGFNPSFKLNGSYDASKIWDKMYVTNTDNVLEILKNSNIKNLDVLKIEKNYVSRLPIENPNILGKNNFLEEKSDAVLVFTKNKEIVKYMYIDSRIIDFSKFETNDGYRPYQGFIIKLDDDQNIYIDKMEE